jgi:hypothetical protein
MKDYKIIGLIGAHYAEDFIGPAIQQALNFCDEVIVSIGAHTPMLDALQDDTLLRAQEFGDQVKFVPCVNDGLILTGKCKTLNNMLEASTHYAPGNWVFMLDVDEFYFDETLQEARDIIENDPKADTIQFPAKFFFINMQRYLHSTHHRLYKIKDRNGKFLPTCSWNSRVEYRGVTRDAGKKGMFHYSLLTPVEYKEAQWKTGYRAKAGPAFEREKRKWDWLEQIYEPFDLDNESYWTDKSLELFPHARNVRTPCWTPGFTADKNGNLYVYDGPHPPVIEEAGLPQIEDFRVYHAAKGRPYSV